MKKILYTGLLIILAVPSFTQENSQSGEIDLRIGFSDMGDFFSYRNVYGVYNLNLNYRASEYFSGGVQFGYGATKLYSIHTAKNVIGTHILMYSLSACFYLTPLFNKQPDPKVDLYVKVKIGAVNLYPTEYQSAYTKETIFDYGSYFGVNYNPFSRLGIFAEVGFGEITFSQFGLSILLENKVL